MLRLLIRRPRSRSLPLSILFETSSVQDCSDRLIKTPRLVFFEHMRHSSWSGSEAR